jgi:alanine racemase
LALGNPDDVTAIRAEGVKLPILLYASTLPDQARAIADLGVVPTVHSFDTLEAFAGLGAQQEVFVKLDCGLGRLGFGADQWREAFRRLARARSLRVGGLYTHFSNPDDAATINRQAELFATACRQADAEGLSGYERMVSSSRIILSRPDLNLSAVNPGRLIYGYVEGEWRGKANLRPVITALRARIIQVKTLFPGQTVYGGGLPLPTAIRAAVVPIGFLDGFNHKPPCHVALVRGSRVPVLGSRGIEHTVLDVTGVADATVGDEAVFLGRQNDELIDQQELAEALQLPLMEILPRLGRMAPRRYLQMRT